MPEYNAYHGYEEIVPEEHYVGFRPKNNWREIMKQHSELVDELFRRSNNGEKVSEIIKERPYIELASKLGTGVFGLLDIANIYREENKR